jgi:hypothetical protein
VDGAPGPPLMPGYLKVERWQFLQRCGDREKYGDNYKAAFFHFPLLLRI